MRRICFAILSTILCPLLVAQQTPTAPNASSTSSNVPQPFTTPAPAAPQQPPPHTLLDGTPVKLRLSQTISPADTKVGQEIPFEVVEEVKVEDAVVLSKGATAIVQTGPAS